MNDELRSDESPDAKLLQAAQNGDRAALEQLLARYQEQIYRFGRKMCPSAEDAEDITQETLLTMAKRLPEFRGDAALSTWLYQIARSFCGKKHRKSKFAPKQLDSWEHELDRGHEPVSKQEQGPEAALAQRELVQALDAALLRVPEDARAVLVLRDIEGLSAKDAAAAMEISVPALKSRLHRARVALRDALKSSLRPHPHPKPTPQCRDIAEMYSKYLEDEVDATLCEQMLQHIEQCPACRRECDVVKQIVSTCKTHPRATVTPLENEKLRAQVLSAYFESDDTP